MNLSQFQFVSVEWLIYLANVAVASIVACCVAHGLVRVWRKLPLPMMHSTLLVALVVALATPIFLLLDGAKGLSLVRLAVENHDIDRVVPAHQPPRAGLGEISLGTPGNLAPAKRPVETPASDRSSTAAADARRTVVENEGSTTESLLPSNSAIAQAIGSFIVGLWAIGAMFCLGQVAVGFVRLQRLVRQLHTVESDSLKSLCGEEAKRFRRKKAPLLFETTAVEVPLTLGWLRPAIVVPVAIVEEFTAEQVRCLLAHELAHIARRDPLVGLLQRASLVLYWWNPLVRRISARISTVREQICDDLATGGAASADGYVAMLVDLAGRVMRQRALPATIGIVGNSSDFKLRVMRLLDTTRSRVVCLDRRMRIVSAGLFVALIAATMAMSVHVVAVGAEESEPAAATAQIVPAVDANADKSVKSPSDEADTAGTAVKWPKTLTGIIKDSSGKPISGAKVRFDLEKIHEYGVGRWDELLYSEEMNTGADGKFSFDASLLPALTHRPFALFLSATAPGYADAKWWCWYTRSDTEIKSQLANLKMEPGRVVRGRCVDPEGKPVAGAIVKAVGDYDHKSITSAFAWDPRQTDEKGEFEISVPRDSDKAVELWVIPGATAPKGAPPQATESAWTAYNQYAPQHAVLPKNGDLLADIRLQRGSKLRGKVLRADGSPAAGVVVVATSIFDGTLSNTTFSAHLAAKTDAAGAYELPPMEGIYQVNLAQAQETDNRLKDRFVVSEVTIPLVMPQKAALSGADVTLDFSEGPTQKVGGNARWADGKPVIGMEVKAIYVRDDFGVGIDLGRAETDAQGNYSIDVPKPIDQLSINAIGAFDSKRKWFTAYADDKVNAEQKGAQFISLKNVDGDRRDLNWVVRPDEEPAAKAEVESSATPKNE